MNWLTTGGLKLREIISRVDGSALATVYTAAEIASRPAGRCDLNDPAESLQVAIIATEAETPYKAHKHIPNPRSFSMTQETWYVVSGRVEADVFDTDDSLVETVGLDAGDLFVVHRGGHGYRCGPSTVVIEQKPGPYKGREVDKVLL